MSLSPLEPAEYRDIVQRALDEDLGGARDVTTDATVPAIARARGVFIANADCVVAGLDVAFECFRAMDSAVQITVRKPDGERCRAGETIAEIAGSARTLLVGERTALNFLQRLSGIATLAARFVEAAGGRITVLDTRKTTPTLRAPHPELTIEVEADTLAQVEEALAANADTILVDNMSTHDICNAVRRAAGR